MIFVLSPERIDEYLQPLDDNQSESIRMIRAVILERAPSLVEQVDEGKWFGGLLTYSTEDGIFVFALGPLSNGFCTFHMMPYYGSPELQLRHGVALKKLLSGKSCVKFKDASQVPSDVLADVVGATPRFVELAKELHSKRTKK